MENLLLWSERMQGARQMLSLLIDLRNRGVINLELDTGKDAKIYSRAIEELALSSLDNIAKYMERKGQKIGYYNHVHNKNNKLKKCNAYFL